MLEKLSKSSTAMPFKRDEELYTEKSQLERQCSRCMVVLFCAGIAGVLKCYACMFDSNLTSVMHGHKRKEMGKTKLNMPTAKSLCAIGLQRKSDEATVQEEGYVNLHNLQEEE
jgi:hypothetical protein